METVGPEDSIGGFSVVGQKKKSRGRLVQPADRKNAALKAQKIDHVIGILTRSGAGDPLRLIQRDIDVIGANG
jgi:hypothetical protein